MQSTFPIVKPRLRQVSEFSHILSVDLDFSDLVTPSLALQSLWVSQEAFRDRDLYQNNSHPVLSIHSSANIY